MIMEIEGNIKQLLQDSLKVKSLKLIEIGQYLHQKGWVPATSGNFSIKLSEKFIAITVSGKHKGRLTEEDIMIVDYKGNPISGKKPSYETLLHTAMYQMDRTVETVLHTHSVAATVLSGFMKDHIKIRDFENLKVLREITTHESEITIPIFDNDQDIAALSERIVIYLRMHPKIYGYLLKEHGLYTWGTSVPEALTHLEALEFLFEVKQYQFLLEARRTND